MRKVIQRISTGIAGLDEVLEGGLISQRAYLLRGAPGTGKTLIGLHFLEAGTRRESPLFIALDEPEYKVRQDAATVGLDLRRVHFLDLSPSSDFFAQVQSYDLFAPAEVERAPITQKLVERVRELKPRRVFVDSMTHFRYFAPNEFEYRKQVLSFLRFLIEQGATVMFTSESSPLAPDDDLQSLSDGVIYLEMNGNNRWLRVTKMRGSSFRTGVHALRINGRGVFVYPQILPEPVRFSAVHERISSGIREMDELLHGGLERGTIVLITGASGVGKTTLGMQFMPDFQRAEVPVQREGTSGSYSRLPARRVLPDRGAGQRHWDIAGRHGADICSVHAPARGGRICRCGVRTEYCEKSRYVNGRTLRRGLLR